MKNIGIVVLHLMLLFNVSYMGAQNTQINWGEQFELEKKEQYYRLVGMDEENYYIISGRAKKSEFRFLTFRNSDHKLLGSEDIQFEYDKTKYSFLESIHTDAGIFLYYFGNNKEANRIELFVAKIDQGKLGNFELVHDQEKEKGLFSNHLLSSQASLLGNGYKIRVRESLSPDKKLVTLSYLLEIKGRFEEVQLLCLNQNMKVEWERKIDFKKEKKKILIGNFKIADDGTVYCLIRVQNHNLLDVASSGQNRRNYFFQIHKIEENNWETMDFLFEEALGYYPVKAILILPKGDDSPVLTGIYSTDKKRSKLEGSFYASIDDFDNVPEMKTYPFENISLVERDFWKAIDKIDLPKPDFNGVESFYFKNGNMALVLENKFVTITNNYSHGEKEENAKKLIPTKKARDQTYTFYSNDILLFIFDKAGNLLTNKIIKKEIESEYKILTSYKGIVGKENLYLIYNHVMNKKERKESGVKGTPTSMTVINDQGDITTEPLFSTGNKAVIPYFYPSRVTKNEGKFLLGRFIGRKMTFGTILLK